MRDLSHKRERFYQVTASYSSLYTYTNKKDQLTVTAGILNFVWNHWNNFWRDFWLAHASGGYDFLGNRIVPIRNNYTDKQSLHYLLYLCGKRRTHIIGDSLNSVHQEATWGDPAIIAHIATGMITHHPYMNYVLGILSHYQTHIQHFQRIRNSFIHLNNENISHLNSLKPYYIFDTHHHLIDILETTEITTSIRCYEYLLDNMTGMLRNL